MAYTIEYTGSFKKDYKRLKKRGLPLDLLKKAIEILVETGALPSEYRPHKLSGIYSGQWECHIMAVTVTGFLFWTI